MNKKRLSVVMAGAMLASSVAPVLAEEVQKSEVSLANKGTLINDLTDLVWNAPRFSDDARVDAELRGKSVYTVTIGDTALNDTHVKAITDASSESRTAVMHAIKNLFKEKSLTVGNVVKLVNHGYTEEKVGENTLILSKSTRTTYTESEIKNAATVEGSLLKELNTLAVTHSNLANVLDLANSGYEEGKGLVLKLQAALTATTYENEEIVITTSTKRIDFTKALAADGSEYGIDENSKFDASNAANNFVKFAEALPAYDDIAESTEKEMTIVSGGTAYELKDLYDVDGSMLTMDKGQNLLSLAKDAYAAYGKKFSSATSGDKAKYVVKVTDLVANAVVDSDSTLGTINAIKADKEGNYKLQIEIVDPFGLGTEADGNTSSSNKPHNYRVFTVTGKDKEGMLRVAKWIDQAKANVDLLAGEDRYETAVRIAKEVAGLGSTLTGSKTKNIVLVNGDSLVDGLSAAPLANYLATNDSNAGNAPILLTETDSLPRATKNYLMDLIDATSNDGITVHIVGGNGVVSKSIEKELKSMKLKVERYGGEDREATSMAVAEKVGTTNGAFVVGATGEADAMSVAGFAADKKMPIIVSGFNGLSEDTLDELDKADVHVIGGDSAVSESDFAAIKSVANKVRRISGSDRKDTNAAVINTFYNNNFAAAESVIVAKDDILIDALTSSNLAAEKHAPIVLATKELSPEQLNAVIANGKSVDNIYQVGYGVANSVVKTVVDALGLK